MMNTLEDKIMYMFDSLMGKYGALVARVFASVLFIFAGFGKITDFAGTSAFIGQGLGYPMPEVITAIVIVVEFGAGIALLLGWHTRYAALALGVFALLTSLLIHMKFSDQGQMIMFMKNLSIAGGMLAISLLGAGPISLDAKKKDTPTTTS